VPASAADTSTPVPSETSTSAPAASPTEDAPVYTHTFADVPDNSWFNDYVYNLLAKGVVSGEIDPATGKWIFRPDDYIIRAEIVKMIVEAFDVKDADAEIDNFKDVKTSDWYYVYVASACNEKLAVGTSDDMFGSSDRLTRQDMVTFSGRALKKYKLYNEPDKAASDKELEKFEDADKIAGYARTWVALHSIEKIVSGDPPANGKNAMFRPDDPVVRSEVAKILSLVIDLPEADT